MTAPTGEIAFIDWLRRRTPADHRVLLGPGDDTAVIRFSSDAKVLVTTDMLLDGSCFMLSEAGARRVGRKAMAVNLSDIAAMAGKPTAAVVSVGLPRSGGRALGEELYAGLRAMADQFDVAIVGGDTNSWDGPLVISVTLFGEATGRGPVTRAGAKVGDWLLTTGPFGGSIYGHHLDFMPRIHEASRLHDLADLHAMIDVSDGLAADVWHICTESQVGAVLRSDAIPVTDAARNIDDGRPPLEHALGDGEDFELVFALAAEDGRQLIETQPVGGITLTAIGECVESGLWLE
ncbi:MAG TPA: thiamine-phosphate kinase, partial [Gemmataceae bacterium]|nr:thiamine-phosphate kinase [Gemmataceae bacterium]